MGKIKSKEEIIVRAVRGRECACIDYEKVTD
jgi:hypothetical protein